MSGNNHPTHNPVNICKRVTYVDNAIYIKFTRYDVTLVVLRLTHYKRILP